LRVRKRVECAADLAAVRDGAVRVDGILAVDAERIFEGVGGGAAEVEGTGDEGFRDVGASDTGGGCCGGYGGGLQGWLGRAFRE